MHSHKYSLLLYLSDMFFKDIIQRQHGRETRILTGMVEFENLHIVLPSTINKIHTLGRRTCNASEVKLERSSKYLVCFNTNRYQAK